MARVERPIAHYLQYLAFRSVAGVLGCFPINANLVTARFLGRALHAIDGKHRRLAREHVRLSFPEMPEEEVCRVARRSFEHMAMLAIEVLFTTRLVHLETLRKYIEFEDFRPLLQLMLTRNQPLILLTGHYGNWEILGYVLATLGFETTSVARPLDNPYINDWVMGVRQKRGQRILAKKGATDEVTQTIAAGGIVGFIADQDAGKKGIFVDFFGRKASTYKSIGLLAMESNAPIIVGSARRLGDRFRFAMGVQDIIRPEDWQNQPDPLVYITQRYSRAIEDAVRKDPGQYLWAHRRWKTRPKAELVAKS